MKHYAFLLTLLIFLFSSCEKDDDQVIILSGSNSDKTHYDLEGKWKLVEIYSSNGETGSFASVKSDKFVLFLKNNEIYSNGKLCAVSTSTDEWSKGSYAINDSTLTIPNCANSPWATKFEVDCNTLIISYPCIEPCKEKYIRLKTL